MSSSATSRRAQFDKGHRRSFRRTWDALGRNGCRSLYHHVTGTAYGNAPVESFFRGTSSFLIDHAFASAGLIDASVALDYGNREDWMISDHVPLTVDICSQGPTSPDVA